MTMTLCDNNRPHVLSLIPVIYNSLGQNKSKELEQWLNNQYEIRPYSFQKISSSPTDSDYKIRDGSRFIEWGLAVSSSSCTVHVRCGLVWFNAV